MFYERRGVHYDWLALWILLSTWATFSGWGLSIFGCLNKAGVLVSLAFFLALVFRYRGYFQHRLGAAGQRIVRSRFLLPRMWLLLVILGFAGGIAYSPNNYDYLTYRFTRVLNWSWDQGWSWIPTVDARINYAGTGFEWLMVPLFVLFKTDRLFFLINFVAYLFMPRLVFSVFSRLGISPRISWICMWVVPCGYCYILQAGSTGNDSFAAIYFLASLHYLFQKKPADEGKNLALSCLAIGLMTGSKASNMPLLLPWFVALVPHWKYLCQKGQPIIIALVVMLAACVSFLPIGLLNIHYTGDYAGDPANIGKMKLNNPVSAVAGNFLQLTKDNLVPPVFPIAMNWDAIIPGPFRAGLVRDFPRLDLHTNELQSEEAAGVGLGIILLLSLFVFCGIKGTWKVPLLLARKNKLALAIVLAGGVASLVYMAKMGSEATSRLMAAYYPLIIASTLLLVALDGRIIRLRAIKWAVYFAILSAIPLVILCPARPLFQTQLVYQFMRSRHVSDDILKRYNNVYSLYSLRAHAFRDLLVFIPPSEKALGFLQLENAPEAALWRPFGTRKVIEVTSETSTAELDAKGIRYLLVSQDALDLLYRTSLASLSAKWSATLLAQKSIVLTIHRGNETWFVLKR